jgi:DUF1680 family protein
MKKYRNLIITIFQLILSTSVLRAQPVNKIENHLKLSAPTEENVRITGGPWYHAMELDKKYLLSLDPDRLLVHFKKLAGLQSNAKEYGGWEMADQELRGHSLGHYLSAISRMSVLTNDKILHDRCIYIVKELNKCQEKIGTGYVSAFPEELLDRQDNLKEVWSPYYTLHKILAGLFDSYKYCSDTLALTTAIKFSHYLYARIKRMTTEHFQQVLDSAEQGGMNEVLWNLYAATGDTISRNLAQSFYQHTYFDPLQQGKENLKGWHSNSFIPNVVGVAREFEVTGEITKKQISELFWQQVTGGRSFVTGGTSSRDAWNADPYHMDEELNPYAQEGCCTYNMLKLSNHLWGWSKDIKYQEYMEKALVNSILSSQNPVSGMSTYSISTAPGYYKTWGTPDSSFWCCTGTGMENFSRIAEYIYGVEDNCLYVNQFVPSELNYKEDGLKLIQETNLPDGKDLKIKIISDKPKSFKLAIRIPSWTGEDYTVKLNGKALESKAAPDSYLLLDRVWHTNDKLEISFTPHLWYALLPVTNKNVAFGYGPVVLAAISNGDKVTEKARHQIVPKGTPAEVPIIKFSPNDFLKNLKVVNLKKLSFNLDTKSGNTISLVPLYSIINEHFSIYLPIDDQKNNIIKGVVDPTKQQKQ